MALTRPLVFLDLETTGPEPTLDRIVEIGWVRMEPGGEESGLSFRVNPGFAIPPEATEVHKITDADVADCPAFAGIASTVAESLEGADIAGYNVGRFDIPLLKAEMQRVTEYATWAPTGQVVDVMRIWHKLEARDLPAAVRRWTGREHEGAHSALGDAKATKDVLWRMLAVGAVGATVDELIAASKEDRSRWVDEDRKFYWRYGEPAFAFGKYKGMRLRKVAATDPGFLGWMLRAEFSDEVKELVRVVLEGGQVPLREKKTDGNV